MLINKYNYSCLISNFYEFRNFRYLNLKIEEDRINVPDKERDKFYK